MNSQGRQHDSATCAWDSSSNYRENPGWCRRLSNTDPRLCQATDARKHMPRSHPKLSTQARMHETGRRYEKWLAENRYGVNARWAFLRNSPPLPGIGWFPRGKERGGDGGEGGERSLDSRVYRHPDGFAFACLHCLLFLLYLIDNPKRIMDPMTPFRSSYPLSNADVNRYQQSIMTIPKLPGSTAKFPWVRHRDIRHPGTVPFQPANFTGRQALPLLRSQGTLLTCCASVPSSERQGKKDSYPCIDCSSTVRWCSLGLFYVIFYNF